MRKDYSKEWQKALREEIESKVLKPNFSARYTTDHLIQPLDKHGLTTIELAIPNLSAEDFGLLVDVLGKEATNILVENRLESFRNKVRGDTDNFRYLKKLNQMLSEDIQTSLVLSISEEMQPTFLFQAVGYRLNPEYVRLVLTMLGTHAAEHVRMITRKEKVNVLSAAVLYSSPENIVLLLDLLGDDVDFHILHKDSSGNSALTYAHNYHAEKKLQLLLERLRDPDTALEKTLTNKTLQFCKKMTPMLISSFKDRQKKLRWTAYFFPEKLKALYESWDENLDDMILAIVEQHFTSSENDKLMWARIILLWSMKEPFPQFSAAIKYHDYDALNMSLSKLKDAGLDYLMIDSNLFKTAVLDAPFLAYLFACLTPYIQCLETEILKKANRLSIKLTSSQGKVCTWILDNPSTEIKKVFASYIARIASQPIQISKTEQKIAGNISFTKTQLSNLELKIKDVATSNSAFTEEEKQYLTQNKDVLLTALFKHFSGNLMVFKKAINPKHSLGEIIVEHQGVKGWVNQHLPFFPTSQTASEKRVYEEIQRIEQLQAQADAIVRNDGHLML